tara:strand:- start:107 stop:412 length:306 start_codon:yes stop_codon:yes gene_type:complete
MARFQGKCKGEKGEASRLGHKRMSVEANTWKRGISVNITKINDEMNHFVVYLTNGSDGQYEQSSIIAEFNALDVDGSIQEYNQTENINLAIQEKWRKNEQK